MKPLLIAMVGLPRSGKSTIVTSLSKQEGGAPIVRRDAIRLAVHGQRYEKQAEPLVKAISLYMIRSLFLAGHGVVICDETHYSKAARDAVRDPRWDTAFYLVDTPVDVCCDRAMMTGQPDLVPVIKEMAERWEPLEVGETLYIPALP